MTDTRPAPNPVRLHDLKPPTVDVQAEVRQGLSAQAKKISPKYLYDQYGSELFEQITRLPEYYPTRTEVGIFRRHLAEIHQQIGTDTQLVEYGSGSPHKIRVLLEAVRPRVYMPVDISSEHLLAAAENIADEYEWLQVHAVCADYTRPMELPWRAEATTLAGFFPGSSIGNFEHQQALDFLRQACQTLGPAGRLLIGVDACKSPQRLLPAYDDASGVTAAFNRNILVHLKRLLGGDVDPLAFDHKAVFNAPASRVEMHLVSRQDQTFVLGDMSVSMHKGETIHTECSHKYSPQEFRALADKTGFDTLQLWQDDDQLFSVFVLQAR